MEHEVRGRISNKGHFILSLEMLGAKIIGHGRSEDFVFDNENKDMKKNGKKLRIRTYHNQPNKKGVLCVKGKKVFKDGLKSRREIEVVVEDYTTTVRILRALGYRQKKIICRDFKTYLLYGTKVRLEDYPELDVGTLVEIEGSKNDIEKVVENLIQAEACHPETFGPWTLGSFLKGKR